MGPIEHDLRERAISARRRLAGQVPVQVIERLAVMAATPKPRTMMPAIPHHTERKPLVVLSIEEADTPLTMSERIIREVAEQHNVKVQEILSDVRSRYLIPARHEAMYRLREERNLSWAQIGRLMNRDHTSVLHGWRKHKAMLEEAA